MMHPLCCLWEFVREAPGGKDKSVVKGRMGDGVADNADAERTVQHINGVVAQAFSSSAEL